MYEQEYWTMVGVGCGFILGDELQRPGSRWSLEDIRKIGWFVRQAGRLLRLVNRVEYTGEVFHGDRSM